MKTPSDNIHKLVRSMTAAEKRYFKRHYSSDKSLLTELFDFLNNQQVYQEDLIKEHFNHTTVSKNLKVYKVQLFDLLLKSLTSHHNKKNIKSKIRMGLEEVEVLLEKELFALARTKLRKLKELSTKYEEYSYLIAILEIEYQLDNFYSVNKVNDHQISQLEQLNLYTIQLNRLYKLRSIYGDTIDRYNHKETYLLNKEEIEGYKKFLSEISAQNEGKTQSIKEQIFVNHIEANIEILLNGDNHRKNQLLQANLALFEDHPHFKDAHPRYYFATFYNYLNSCCNIHDFESLDIYLPRIKSFVEKHASLGRNYLFIYLLEIRANYLQENFMSITRQLEEKMQLHVKKYDQENDFLTARIYVLLVHTYLILKKPQRVQFYLRRLQTIAKQIDSPYVQFTELLELISHYETKDFALMEKQIASLKRKLRKKTQATIFYADFLDFLKQLSKAKSITHKNELATNFQKSLDQDQYKKDPVFNLLMEFTLSNWITSIIKGFSFAEIKNP